MTDKLNYSGNGRVSSPISEILSSPKVQKHVAAARKIRESQMTTELIMQELDELEALRLQLVEAVTAYKALPKLNGTPTLGCSLNRIEIQQRVLKAQADWEHALIANGEILLRLVRNTFVCKK